MIFSCSGWLIGVNSAADKIILGSGGIINNAPNIIGTPTGTATVNNQMRCLIDLAASCTINNRDTNQTLSIRQDATDFTAGNLFCLDLKNFTVTFDGPGTNSFTTPTEGTHAGGAIKGTGGVIQRGIGQTSFSATNTYTGPTIVRAGQLIVRTWSAGGGSYSVSNGANLQVTVGSPGTTLNTTNLIISSTTGTNSLTLAFGSLGNPTAPVVYATNLTLNGTAYLSVSGAGLSTGTIPLIRYEAQLGSGTLTNNLLPPGVTAYLTNNTVAKQWQLVVSSVPNLIWVGRTNSTVVGNWDIGGTSNWFNTATAQSAYYADGLPVRFDDSGFTSTITLATNVAPFSITVNNSAKTYTLGNDGTAWQANPSGGFIKDGPGLCVLTMSNSYTSFTAIKQGTLRTDAANAIGRGIGNSGATLTNNGTLDLNGFIQNIGPLYGSGLIVNGSPSSVTLQSQAGGASGGFFTGRIDEGSGGAITLSKSGGTLTLTGNNRYSGGTRIITGGASATRAIILGGNNVLGSGPVIFENNGILSPDASPRTLTNTISIQSLPGTSQSFSLGSPGAGLLTLSGPFANDSGEDKVIVCGSAVLLSGPIFCNNGGFQAKEGPGTLTLQGNPATLLQKTSDSRISDGRLILDGAAMSVFGVTAPNFRVQSMVTDGLASLLITNNGSLTVGDINGYYRLRLGDTSSPTNTLGQQCTTNIADIWGTLIAGGVTMGYSGSTISTNDPGPSETYSTNYNGGGAYARLSLLPGSTSTLGQISASPSKTVTEVYLDGAVINVPSTASSSFLQGLTNVFIQSGGVTLNGANLSSIHVRQNLLAGSGAGGLTWNGGSQSLQLDGTNTYTGTTLVNQGDFGGDGTLAGPLVMANGSVLIPGGGGDIDTFTINSNLTLNAGAVATFELNTTNYVYTYVTNGVSVITNVALLTTNDYLVVSGAMSIADSTLNVQNDGGPLVLGDKFKLFSRPVSGGFTTINLPPLDPGLAWNNKLAVDGSIAVVDASIPTPPALGMSQSGNVLTFTWSEPGFKLQAQTNALSIGISNNWHDYPGGDISGVTATITPANPAVFYRLSQ